MDNPNAGHTAEELRSAAAGVFDTSEQLFEALTISDGLLFTLNDNGLAEGPVTAANLSRRSYLPPELVEECLFLMKKSRLVNKSSRGYAMTRRGHKWVQNLKALAKYNAMTQAEYWKKEYQKREWNTHAAKDFLRDIDTVAKLHFQLVPPANRLCGLWVFPDDSALLVEFPDGQLPKEPLSFTKRAA